MATWPRPWAEMVTHRLAQQDLTIRQFSSNRDLPSLGPLVSIVSSQIPSRLVEAKPWSQVVESILHAIQRDAATLLIGIGTPLEERLVHWCRRLGLPYIKLFVEMPSMTPSIASPPGNAHEFKRASRPTELTSRTIPSTIREGEGWLRIDAEASAQTLKSPNVSISVIDTLLSWLPDRVFAINLRKHGKTTRAIDERLDCEEFPLATVHCAIGDWQPDESQVEAKRLMDRGAIGWWCSTADRSYELAWLPWVRAMGSPLAPIVPGHPVLDSAPGDWLIHCTRSRRGPWPDQTVQQHADEILLQPCPQAGAWLTLARILQQRRIIATTYLRRSSVPTVCMSASPLLELLRHRKYRPHLGRWDWEPYGICIRSQVAKTLGARPAIYGNDSDFSTLSEEDAPFFQAMQGARSQIDWGFEQEWRFIGDVKLGKIPWTDACVFVPSMTEARWMARLSPFPIVPLKCDG